MKTNPLAAGAFLDLIHGEHVHAGLRYVVWQKASRKARAFSHIDDGARYACAAGADVYVSMSAFTAPPSGRGTADEAASIACVWLDVDVGEKDNGKTYPPDRAAAFELLAALPLKPSVVVDSGTGFHAYWLLHEPLEHRDRAKRIARGWCDLARAIADRRGWELDSVGDLARVLRVPGTVHGGTGRQVELLTNDPLRYDPDDLEPLLPEPREAMPAVLSDVAPSTAEAAPWADDLARRNNRFHRTWNRRRDDLADQSASAYDAAIAAAGVRDGWSDQQIADAMRVWRTIQNDRPEKATRRDYLVRTIGVARRHQEQGNGNMNKTTAATWTENEGRAAYGSNPASGEDTRLQAVVTDLGTVLPREVEWLWEPRIPLGMVSVIAGAKGTGKGQIATAIVAAVTSAGTMPDGGDPTRCVAIPQGRVVLLNAEDPVAETLVPRLIEAGADRSKVKHLAELARRDRKGDPVPLTLGLHWPYILEVLEDVRPLAFVIDTMTSHAGADLNSNSEMAPIMARLAGAAERFRMAVLLLHHVVKVPHARAAADVSGAGCIATSARSVLIAGADEGKERRGLFHVDSNVGPEAPPIGYHVAPLCWMPIGDLELGDVRFHGRRRAGRKLENAKAYIRDALEAGPMLSTALKDGRGTITAGTFDRARGEVEIETGRIGNASWSFLPEHVERFRALKDNAKRNTIT